MTVPAEGEDARIVVEFAAALLYPAGIREPRFALHRGRIVVRWKAPALRTARRARPARSLRSKTRGQRLSP